MKVKKVLFVVTFCILLIMICTNIVNATEYEIEEEVTTIVQTPVITPDTSNEGETVEEYAEDEIFVEVENDWENSLEGIIPGGEVTPEVDNNKQPEILIYEMPSDEPARINYVSYVTEEMDDFDENIGKLYSFENNDTAIYLNIIFANILVFVVVILMIIISLIKKKKENKKEI